MTGAHYPACPANQERRLRELEAIVQAARDVSECFTEEGSLSQTVFDETLHRKIAKLRKALSPGRKETTDE